MHTWDFGKRLGRRLGDSGVKSVGGKEENGATIGRSHQIHHQHRRISTEQSSRYRRLIALAIAN
ncbi:hypothetical protein TYRP_008014 [Tyrophagus putrescentiae]|nr:hypothetical protein TYRP_008014 [Tyrophagus putrescentiae]